MTGTLVGFSLIVCAAVCGGGFALPLKHRRRFALENTYVFASFSAMIIIPTVVAQLFLPQWTDAIEAAGPETAIIGVAFGFGWGLGAVAFGYGVTLVGLSLGYSIIMGVNTVVGSVIPFVIKSPEDMATAGGIVVLVGILACVAGVITCGWAGVMREADTTARRPTNGAKGVQRAEGEAGHFWFAVLVCVASGILSASANLGFAFTSSVGAGAEQMGAGPAVATLGSWILVYWGGFAATLLWFGGRQLRNGTWRLNVGPDATHDLVMAVTMGTLWFLAMFLYGIGSVFLGRLGTSIGWALNMAASLLVANALGFMTGEWKGASRKSMASVCAGLIVLVLAMVILSAGNSMLAR